MKSRLAAVVIGLLPWLTVIAGDQKGLVVLPNGGSSFSGPQGREADLTEILAASEQTGGGLGLFRQIIAPKSGPPVHIHRTSDEFFYVVSGEFNFKLADRIVSVPARSIVFVPRGTAHTFKNVGTEPGVLLVGVTPGGLEKMFAERQGVDSATATTCHAGGSFSDIGCGDVHLVRNETGAVAQDVAVQIIPAGQPRRIDAPDPGNCPPFPCAF
jgi:mannose-6-phosphate isomerase-like protein (cupin superfamily)